MFLFRYVFTKEPPDNTDDSMSYKAKMEQKLTLVSIRQLPSNTVRLLTRVN